MDYERHSLGSKVVADRVGSCTAECAGPLVEHPRALAIRIERLPAVATLDWCDQAAQCLASEFCQSIAAVILATVGPSGELVNIEAAGVGACGSEKPELLAAVRSELETIGALPIAKTNTTAVSLHALLGDAWTMSRTGRIFRPAPCTDVFLTIRPIVGGEAGRAIISILGVTAECVPMAKSVPADVQALVWSSTSHIAERALVAIGGQRSTRSRWISEREREVLDLLVLGMSVRQIAEEIGRSTHTVHDHVKSLHKKLNASSRGELVARALGHLGTGAGPAKTTLRAMPGSAIEPSKPMIDLSREIAGEIEQKHESGRPARAKQLPLE